MGINKSDFAGSETRFLFFFYNCFFPIDEHKFIYVCCHQVHRAVACIFEGSAIIASHSCSSCHAGCLAFSFLGGSIEALTCSVSLYSCCLFSLRREALTFFDRPPRMLTPGIQASFSLSLTPSLILYLFPSPNFSIGSSYLFHSACPSVKAGFSPSSCAGMSVRGERGVSQRRRTHSFVSYYTTPGAVAVCVYQPLLLPPPEPCLHLTQIPAYYFGWCTPHILIQGFQY